MFQSQTVCSGHNASFGGHASLLGAEPGLIGRRLLAIAGAVAFAASVAALPQHQARVQTAAVPQIVVVHASTPTALRDRAEAMRAEMLARPGVVDVRVDGLRQQALSVRYDESRLRAAGLSGAQLAAALKVDAAGSRAGLLKLQTDDMQSVADTRVESHGQMVRVGDITQVVREKLDVPVATISPTGEQEARLTIVSKP